MTEELRELRAKMLVNVCAEIGHLERFVQAFRDARSEITAPIAIWDALEAYDHYCASVYPDDDQP